MTSISNPQEAPHLAPPAVPARMPRAVRLGLAVTLAALTTGALYLMAVRGEALLIDLAALGGRMWCF